MVNSTVAKAFFTDDVATESTTKAWSVLIFDFLPGWRKPVLRGSLSNRLKRSPSITESDVTQFHSAKLGRVVYYSSGERLDRSTSAHAHQDGEEDLFPQQVDTPVAMPRSRSFHFGRQPLQDEPQLQLQPSRVSGPVPFCNPTRAHFNFTPRIAAPERDHVPGRIERLWRSRDNRKGRHALMIHQRPPGPEGQKLPAPTVHPAAIAQGIRRMFTSFPYWDVSYLVATIFTFGSVIWVINAFFVWLPLVAPGTEFHNEGLVGGGVTAFIGATIFEVGSVLLILEAVNENQTGCFGWAVETASKQAHTYTEQVIVRIKSDMEACIHPHANHRSFLGHQGKSVSPVSVSEVQPSPSATPSMAPAQNRSFKWVPTRTELRRHYFHELGFYASLVQLIGATIFWIAGFTGLPGIINHMDQAVTNGVYWVPQIVGGMCFVLSGLLFTLETQRKWYLPAFHILGWHIGFWNFLGGIGFTLCGALGPATANSGVLYQGTLATFWGSWAFLVGSTIQWYESLDKHPVEETT
ncbi:hypothetical protein P175DRAFT_0554252 [Aspergillus ochraceoroseus IBT 24754]|nr:uncharacterized protein P175DRAFT_0554252 [Aspergillus ochraceoroseus IBT 24754]PTU25002.1 hypothetical protein P175DRAFT_0554252 [Aspergillus ochraceoroseus IBT 24754]